MTQLNKMFDEFNEMANIEPSYYTSTFCFRREMLTMEETLETLDEVCEYYDFTLIRKPGQRGEIVLNDFKLKPVIDIVQYLKESGDKIYMQCQGMREMKMDIDGILQELHRSNMTKRIDLYDNKLAILELEKARERYPDVQLLPHGDYYTLYCPTNQKLVKPSDQVYSPAIMDVVYVAV